MRNGIVIVPNGALVAMLNRNERSERCNVKAVMDRVKITLVSLLPALWLMSSGQYFLDPCGNCATARTHDSTFAFESGQHCPSNAKSSIDLSARRANSRVGSHSAKTIFPLVEPVVGSQVHDRRFLATFSSSSESPRALATRWQFDYRAAPEPRAPSSVS